MSPTLSWVLVLALAGLANAAYAALVTYGVLRAGRLAGADLCDPSGCSTVMHTPWGSFMGLPNAVWGIGFYVAILLMTAGRVLFAGTAGGSLPAGDGTGGVAHGGGPEGVLTLLSLLCAAAVTIYGAWLIGVLVFRLERPCPICYMAHAINLILLILLLASAS